MSWVTVIALTRAQLISGNSANGIVLPGNPQGVIAGAGITIDSGGIISVNAATAVGVMRLNNPGAYNAYVWPLGGGLAGQQLTSDGAGNLGWANAAGIPWTAKGQLVVGTGLNTDTILSAGANTAFLMADNTTGSGLVYSDSVTSAVQLPAGGIGARPAGVAGQFRYNTGSTSLEYFDGVAWQTVATTSALVSSFSAGTTGLTPSAATSGAVVLGGTLSIANGGTGATTGSAALSSLGMSVDANGGTTGLTFSGGPVTSSGILTLAGTLALANGGTGGTTQPTALNNLLPSQGGNVGKVLATDGTNASWVAGGGGGTGTVTSVDVSGGTTGLTYSGGPITASGTITMAGTLAVANGGTGATTAAAAMVNLLPAQAGNSGKVLATDGLGVLSWTAVGGTGTVTSVTGTAPIVVATGTTTPAISITAASTTATGAVQLATAAEAAAGTDALKALTPATGVPKDASGMTGAALLPGGATAARPTTPAAGWLRFNTSSDAVSPLPECEVYDGTNWRGLEYRPDLGASLPVLALTNGQTMPVAGNYETITVPAGATVTALAGTILTARSGITISGTINVSASIPGGAQSRGVSGGSTVAFGGGGGQGPGAQGFSYGFGVLSLGSGAGAASVRVNNIFGATGSRPGNGGGGLILVSQSALTVNSTAVINANGENAGAGNISAGGNGHTVAGSGGGSGGAIYLQAGSTLTVAAGATLSAEGGDGWPGYCDGTEAGGGAGGGGGGGGGYIILNAPATNNSGTLSVAGGVAGADAASAPPASGAFLGTAGAGFGGNGGLPNSGTFPNTAGNGSAGQILTNVYVF